MAIGSWFRILTNSREIFYKEENNASLGGIITNIVLVHIILFIVLMAFVLILLIPVLIKNPEKITDELTFGLIIFILLMIISTIISIVISLIGIFIASLIVFFVSKLFGSLGDFITQTYLLSIIWASSTIVNVIIAGLPSLILYSIDGAIAMSFGNVVGIIVLIVLMLLSIYYLYITIVMLEEVHEFGALKSILTIVISTAIMVVGLIAISILLSFVLSFGLSAMLSTIISSMQINLQTNEIGEIGVMRYTEYTSPEYNFHIKYPENWTVNETSEGVIFHSGDDAAMAVSVRENIGDMSLIGVSKIMGVQRLYKLREIPYEGISQDGVKLNGRDAYQIITIATIDTQKVKTKEIFMVENGNAYAITYSAKFEPIDIYSKYENVIDECINSFSIVGSRGEKELTISKMRTHETIKTSGFSYELYLPDDYSQKKSYPLIFCMSPNGNGRDFYNSVYPIANRYDHILACSNDFSNYKAIDEFLPQIYNAIDDIQRRVNIDENRIYACGFSGGGMATYVVSYFKPNYFTGLIVNNGAIHGNLYDVDMLKQMGVKKVALICGKEDSIVSCSHMRNDAKWLNSAGIETKIIEFDGGHEIAPPDAYEEAILWIES
ncbi:MAG: hypothetical protein DRO95_03460 [Candidatus Altiarchaeales archaeon]|nr:MAG: hypothetical protein DRO95_03460 [Candidatus Altiarchaeales archaeon]